MYLPGSPAYQKHIRVQDWRQGRKWHLILRIPGPELWTQARSLPSRKWRPFEPLSLPAGGLLPGSSGCLRISGSPVPPPAFPLRLSPLPASPPVDFRSPGLSPKLPPRCRFSPDLPGSGQSRQDPALSGHIRAGWEELWLPPPAPQSVLPQLKHRPMLELQQYDCECPHLHWTSCNP